MHNLDYLQLRNGSDAMSTIPAISNRWLIASGTAEVNASVSGDFRAVAEIARRGRRTDCFLVLEM